MIKIKEKKSQRITDIPKKIFEIFQYYNIFTMFNFEKFHSFNITIFVLNSLFFLNYSFMGLHKWQHIKNHKRCGAKLIALYIIFYVFADL